MKRSCVYGLAAGITVCVLGVVRGELVYLGLGETLGGVLLMAVSLLGMAVSVLGLVYRADTFRQTLVRFVVFLLSTGGCFVLGAQLRLWSAVHLLFAESSGMSGMTDNVSGLLLVTYLITVGITTVMILLVRGISAAVRQGRRRGKA